MSRNEETWLEHGRFPRSFSEDSAYPFLNDTRISPSLPNSLIPLRSVPLSSAVARILPLATLHAMHCSALLLPPCSPRLPSSATKYKTKIKFSYRRYISELSFLFLNTFSGENLLFQASSRVWFAQLGDSANRPPNDPPPLIKGSSALTLAAARLPTVAL